MNEDIPDEVYQHFKAIRDATLTAIKDLEPFPAYLLLKMIQGAHARVLRENEMHLTGHAIAIAEYIAAQWFQQVQERLANEKKSADKDDWQNLPMIKV